MRLKVFRSNLKQLLAKLFFKAVPREPTAKLHQAIGLNLVGYYRADLGLGEALRYTAKALVVSKIPFLVRQFEVRLRASQMNDDMRPYLSKSCNYPINCIFVAPDMIFRLPTWLNYSEWAKRYNIGYWFWELANFPKNWEYAIPLVDEIWVNTEFVASAMRQVHPCVVKIPFAVQFDLPSAQYTRSFYNLPQEGVLFLCTFDFNSAIDRKNPKAAIAAFIKAFPNSQTQALLVIKSINSHLHPTALSDLQAATKGDHRVVFINHQLSTAETRGLLQCADCYVSLHRSEGLGLGMAESMYLGKPVIATAYSGNLEFMNSDNACLVNYTEVPVPAGAYVQSSNQVWADPDIETAARAMQMLAHHPEQRLRIGANARQYMLEHHSFEVMGAAIVKRIKAISQKRRD